MAAADFFCENAQSIRNGSDKRERRKADRCGRESIQLKGLIQKTDARLQILSLLQRRIESFGLSFGFKFKVLTNSSGELFGLEVDV